MVALFLGGWHVPGFGALGLEGWVLALAQVVCFIIKVGIILLFFIQVRWTLPRLRYDQLMNFGWKVMLPLGLLNVLVTGLLVAIGVL